MTTRVPFLAVLLAVTALLATGCMPNRVTFDHHQPYRSPVRIDSPLIIVVPDDLDEQKQRVNMRTVLFFRDRFDVYYGQSLRTEGIARYGNMFSEIVLLSETVYNQLRIEEGLQPLRLSESDPMEDEPETSRRSQREENEEAMRRRELLEFVPQFAREPTGYVLTLERPRYAFIDGRSIIAVQAGLRDRFTDEILLQGTMRGQSTRITPRQSAGLREYELHKSVISANSALYNNMRDRIRRAIEDDIARNR